MFAGESINANLAQVLIAMLDQQIVEGLVGANDLVEIAEEIVQVLGRERPRLNQRLPEHLHTNFDARARIMLSFRTVLKTVR